MGLQITYIGGPTALIEIGGLRLLTDPTFDPAGRRYHFGWGAVSRKLQDPAIKPGDLGPIDAVLLSHDHHEDNLDRVGRGLLPSMEPVITTVAGARRLGGGAIGLEPWRSTVLTARDGTELVVTATIARHGPPLSRWLVGEVIGFILQSPHLEHGAVWISGDTVYYKGVREVGARFDIGTAIIHLGAVRFPVSGPARYTMTAAQAARLAQEFSVRTLIPIHYEGWKHFRQGREQAERALSDSAIRERVEWLSAGRTQSIDA